MALLGALTLAGAACGDELGSDGADNEDAEGGTALVRTGELRVVVEPGGDSPGLEMHARFVEFHDLPAEDAASRAGLRPVATEILRPGQCMATSQLVRLGAAELELPTGPEGGEDEARRDPTELAASADPELSLIDAGDVRVALGDRDYVLSVSLVPDLVPWVSGVEYGLSEADLPHALFTPDGVAPLGLEVDGAPDLGLPPFSLQLELPAAFVLLGELSEPLDPDAMSAADARSSGVLELAWQPEADPDQGEGRMVFELVALDASGEPNGAPVTCLVPDTGAAALPLDQLAAAGLGEGPRVSVAAKRSVSAVVDAGDFKKIRVVAEMRARQVVSLHTPR